MKQKEAQIEQKIRDTQAAMKEELELEKERIVLQSKEEKIKAHAMTTQEIYDDIYNTLHEKFRIEQKAKLTEITTRLKKSFEDKVSQLENC